jgi:hypothetical protein
MEKSMLVNGKTTKDTVKELINGQTEKGTMVNGQKT